METGSGGDLLWAFVESRSVIVKRDDSANGTGVCVQVGGRYFIATAGHNLPEPPEARRVRIDTDLSSIPAKDLRRRGKVAGDIDIAWIAIEEKHAGESGKHFVPIDRLVQNPRFNAPAEARCFGYPGAKSKKHDRGRLVIEPVGIPGTICAARIPVSDAELEVPVDSEIDMFVKFSEKCIVDIRSRELGYFGERRGVSGGGIWVFDRDTAGSWVADSARLIAIHKASVTTDAKSAIGFNQWLRGTWIRHWLQMVAEDIEELASAIVQGKS